MESLQKLLKKENNYALLHFYKLPPKHRIVVTYNDILKLTGKYYVRIYGKSDSQYAKKSSKKEYFTIVEEKFINTNINKMNLNNEYSVY